MSGNEFSCEWGYCRLTSPWGVWQDSFGEMTWKLLSAQVKHLFGSYHRGLCLWPLSLAALKQGRGRDLKGCVGKDVTNLYRMPTPLPSLRQWNQTGLSGVCSQGPNQFCLLTQFEECVWFLELYCHLNVLYLPSWRKAQIMMHKNHILGTKCTVSPS